MRLDIIDPTTVGLSKIASTRPQPVANQSPNNSLVHINAQRSMWTIKTSITLAYTHMLNPTPSTTQLWVENLMDFFDIFFKTIYTGTTLDK